MADDGGLVSNTFLGGEVLVGGGFQFIWGTVSNARRCCRRATDMTTLQWSTTMGTTAEMSREKKIKKLNQMVRLVRRSNCRFTGRNFGLITF